MYHISCMSCKTPQEPSTFVLQVRRISGGTPYRIISIINVRSQTQKETIWERPNQNTAQLQVKLRSFRGSDLRLMGILSTPRVNAQNDTLLSIHFSDTLQLFIFWVYMISWYLHQNSQTRLYKNNEREITMAGCDIPHDKQSALSYEILHSCSHDSFLPCNTGLPPCWEHPIVLMLVLHISMVPMSKRRM